MGTVSIIPTRLALKGSFDRSAVTLIQKYDPVALVSSTQEEQEAFVNEAVGMILRHVETSNPFLPDMQKAARENLEIMLQNAGAKFRRDHSLSSQERIRKIWRAEIPERLDSIQSIGLDMTGSKKVRIKPVAVKTLITRPVLSKRFQEAALSLSLVELRDFRSLPDLVQHTHVEDIIQAVTQEIPLGEMKKVNMYGTLHEMFYEVCDLLQRSPYHQSMPLASKKALEEKAKVESWIVDFVYNEFCALR